MSLVDLSVARILASQEEQVVVVPSSKTVFECIVRDVRTSVVHLIGY